MTNQLLLRLLIIINLIVLQSTIVRAEHKNEDQILLYAVKQIGNLINEKDIFIPSTGINYLNNKDLVILTIDHAKFFKEFEFVANEVIKPEGYMIRRIGRQVVVVGGDATGALYGTMDVKEQLMTGIALSQIQEKKQEPRFEFRAIKFNLPFMSYRQNYCLTQQDHVVRDLKFWESFLDMMVQNRYNVLSLWSLHPFHYMIKPKNFPEATSFTDIEMMAWKNFWTKLFDMAHERGIETYIINWNTFVSPSFAASHNVAKYSSRPNHFGVGDTSAIIEQYTKEVITQVINEYPGLDGLGITLGERMGGQSTEERRLWLDRTIFAGMKAADRKIKFVYRAPLSANEGSGGSTSEENDLATRAQIESLDIEGPAYVEFKFNWSHGHSSPKLFIVHGGKLTDKYKDPLPTDYKYIWTLRNEDFYLLRWGQPDFVRDFITNNGDEFVGGVFLGSEVFIPAMDFMSKDGKFKDWDYHFERQWLWYASWGRLLYNPATKDEIFENLLAAKYKIQNGKTALSAWKHATNNQLWFAAYHMGKVDGGLYTEGFCAWGDSRPVRFFDINNIIHHQVLDTSLYINVADWIQQGEKTKDGIISPLQFAAKLDDNNAQLLKEIEHLKSSKPSEKVMVEINDMEAWYWFGRYFSDKLKAAVHVQRYRSGGKDERPQATRYLKECSKWWNNYTNSLSQYNKDTMLFHTDKDFSWKAFQKDVDKDIEIALEDKVASK